MASDVAGKSVQVRCHDPASWAALTAANGAPSTAYGLARVDGTVAELAPSICSALDDLWAGSPLGCTTVVAVKVRTKVWAWVTIRKRVRVKVDGEWVYRVRPVRVRRLVERTVTRNRTVPAPCVALPDRARAVHTLAHETFHLAGHESELDAHCYGLQHVASVYERLSGDATKARAAAALAWTDYRENPRVRAYFSTECRDGGALDMRPADAVWP